MGMGGMGGQMGGQMGMGGPRGGQMGMGQMGGGCCGPPMMGGARTPSFCTSIYTRASLIEARALLSYQDSHMRDPGRARCRHGRHGRLGEQSHRKRSAPPRPPMLPVPHIRTYTSISDAAHP